MERRRKADSQNIDLASYTFPVGTVVGFHALKGEVKVRPSTNNPDLLAEIETVSVQYPKGKRPQDTADLLRVTGCRLERRMLLLKFEGLDDRNSVEPLAGAQLFTCPDQLSPLEEEEFWVQDLVGLDVFTVGGELVGVVTAIIGGATDLLEIRPANPGLGEKRILIPFVKKLVPSVSLGDRRIEVDPIPGLLEPQ